MKLVPVLASNGEPLAACHPARARELVRRGTAVRRFKPVFHIQLQSGLRIQPPMLSRSARTSGGARD